MLLQESSGWCNSCQNESLANFGANVKKQPGFQKVEIQCWATKSKHAGMYPASTLWGPCATKENREVFKIEDTLLYCTDPKGFELQEEKIQRMPPWKYLGVETDSAYVTGVVSRAKQAVLSEVSNSTLFYLLSKLVNLISHQEQQVYMMHIRSHTDLPGFIAKGNRSADALAVPVEMAPLPNIFGQAKISHQLFHQNAPSLVWSST
ncbi:hypothetical protein DUI87_05122 [Hirundo rustica rustica]|uniref:Uncharacterized protein n=1 Tax=Hirundo rustica rustica TaxID=333673 RepID=A0A3M0L5H5_HIRRU|nr:hypothetical protein DUI87_05122 [Hirundo rustica rustica]